MLIADEMPQEARHRSEGARMGVRFKERPVERKLAGIKAQTRPWLFQSEFQVVFVGDEVDRAGASFVSDNQVEERIQRSFLFRRRDSRPAGSSRISGRLRWR